MKTRLTDRDHRCNAVKFLAGNYVALHEQAQYLKTYRLMHKCESRYHTALEEMVLGFSHHLRAMLLEMGGYEFLEEVENGVLKAVVPQRAIDLALARCKLQKTTRRTRHAK